jgi:hypothetical protein
MHAIGDGARGVVVVDTGVTDDQLSRLHAAGVRGVRFFMFQFDNAVPFDYSTSQAALVTIRSPVCNLLAQIIQHTSR